MGCGRIEYDRIDALQDDRIHPQKIKNNNFDIKKKGPLCGISQLARDLPSDFVTVL